MPLDAEDWEKMKKLLADNNTEIAKSFTVEMVKVESALKLTGKRLNRLEAGFDHNAKLARTAVVEGARRDYDRLIRGMFDDSALLVVPPLVDDGTGGRTKATTNSTLQNVDDFVKERVGDSVKYEIELADKIGFRILISSRSAQTRRKGAASIIKKVKKDLEAIQGLRLLYDKPYELRQIQREAHKFLSAVARLGGDTIREKKVDKGFLVVNGVRMAPEFLLPEGGRRDYLASVVVDKVRGWRSLPPSGPEEGVLFDVFAAEFAAEKGIVSLHEIEDIPLSDEGAEMMQC
jgi:hypothetical protein